MTLGQRMAELLAEHDVHAQEVELAVGVAARTVRGICDGKPTRRHTVQAVARAVRLLVGVEVLRDLLAAAADGDLTPPNPRTQLRQVERWRVRARPVDAALLRDRRRVEEAVDAAIRRGESSAGLVENYLRSLKAGDT